jgi:pimeloyl-ACP methyl ester carboxylesterase
MQRLAMMGTMNCEFLQIQTPDGLKLHGILHRAKHESTSVALLVHGVGSNFYSCGFYRQVTESLISQGVSVVWTNNRGHDSIYSSTRQGRVERFGSAYENVSDGAYDVSGWCDAMKDNGFAKIFLIGHSLGAIKVLYSQASQHEHVVPHPRVAGIVAASPPCLSFERFQSSPESARFQTAYRACSQKVAEGEGDALVKVDFPFPLLIAASTFVDKYGPANRYDFLKWLYRIRTPFSFVYGERELRETSFEGLPQSIAQIAPECLQGLDIIPNADHFYLATHDLMSQAVVASILRMSGVSGLDAKART